MPGVRKHSERVGKYIYGKVSVRSSLISYPLHLTLKLLPSTNPHLVVLKDVLDVLLHEELKGLRGVQCHSARLAPPLSVFLVASQGNGRCCDLLILLLSGSGALWVFWCFVSRGVCKADLLLG